MGYNIIENIQYCQAFVEPLKTLLLYSHLFPLLAGLVLTFFLLHKSTKTLLTRIFLLINVTFACWCVLNLGIWFGYTNNSLLMSSWSLLEIFSILLFILVLCFVYVFSENKAPPISMKIALAALFLPFIFISATPFNLLGYDIQECVAIENPIFAEMRLIIKIILITWLIGIIVYKLATRPTKRRELAVIGFGGVGFVFSFFIAGYISELTENYTFELYGLFGMIILIGSLAYAIIKYGSFNMRVFGAQVLVVALITLVGSQFLFIDTLTGVTLNAVTLLAIILLGVVLLRSVRKEVDDKEEMRKLASDFQTANNQLLITNTKLEEANEKLKELDAQKTEFVSLATHQLRGPLGAIKGYASLILEGDYGELSAPARQSIEVIMHSAQSMIVLVGDYLDISRIEQGKMKYDFTDFDARELVETVINEFTPVVQTTGLQISFNYSKRNVYKTHADSGKIKQVISNLLDNAIKYSPKGTIHVSVEKTNKLITIKIRDNGVGIKKEVLPLLFNKFTRAPDASKTNIIGTGLGLFVARKIMEAHEGRVWAESEGEGKGSTFIMELKAN